MIRLINSYIKGDKVIWMVVLLLTTLSVLAVYSSTNTLAYRFQKGNTEYYLLKHLSSVVFGLIIMYGIHRVNYKVFSLFSKVSIFIAIPLLMITLLMGAHVNSASRWLTLPIVNWSFQTSDLAKIGLIMFVALNLAKKQDNIKDFKTAFLPLIGVIGITCALIIPANFSTAALLFLTSVVLLFIGRVNIKHLLILGGIGIVAIAIFVLLIFNFPKVGRFGTWKARIENFKGGNEDENYQANNSKMAIQNGGLLGKGPGNSEIKNFLPEAYSDFIYAIIIEEYGLVIGGLGVILMYLILLIRAIRIARRSQSLFCSFLTIGLTIQIVFQAFVNLAVAVNLGPVTGQPLPLLSMGGTSMWFTSIALGMVLSVSRENELLESNASEPVDQVEDIDSKEVVYAEA